MRPDSGLQIRCMPAVHPLGPRHGCLRRARKTVLDFFKPLAGGARAAGSSPKATVQRNTRNSPEEGIARFLQGRDAAPQQRAKSAAQAPIALSDSSDGEEAPRKRRRGGGKEGRDTTEAERTHKLGRAEARATDCEPASSAMKCEVPGSDGNCHVDAATRTAAGRGAAMKPKEDPAGGHVAPNRQHPLTEGDGKLNRQQAARQEGGEKLVSVSPGSHALPSTAKELLQICPWATCQLQSRESDCLGR